MRQRSWKPKVFALLLLLAALARPIVFAQSGAASGISPYTLREDFQHDSLGQFASYPPAQDVGYEPSLTPTNDFAAPGGRALMRVVKPNRTGALRFGFIRQTFLVMSEGAKLSFAYRLNHAVVADEVRPIAHEPDSFGDGTVRDAGQGAARQGVERVDVRQHGGAARPQHAGELVHDRREIRDVGEGEGAGDDVDAGVVQRERLQQASAQVGVGQLRPARRPASPASHRRR